MELAERVRAQAGVSGQANSMPKVTVELLPNIPADFGAAYEGVTVRYKFVTGWSRGILKTYKPRAGKYTFEIVFDGARSRIDVQTKMLRPGYYVNATTKADAERCEVGSWNLLVPRVGELVAEGADSEESE